LNKQIEELQEWVADRGVQVDQKSLEASMTAGKAATASRDYKQAIYHYCNVFTDLTRHAREKGDAKDDESIDY